jgi:hypothetical protein
VDWTYLAPEDLAALIGHAHAELLAGWQEPAEVEGGAR